MKTMAAETQVRRETEPAVVQLMATLIDGLSRRGYPPLKRCRTDAAYCRFLLYWGVWDSLHPYDFALNLFAFSGLDLGLVAVDLVFHVAAHDEIRRIHRLVGVGPAGIGLVGGAEGEIVGLMFLILALYPGRLRILEHGRALKLLIGESRDRHRHYQKCKC